MSSSIRVISRNESNSVQDIIDELQSLGGGHCVILPDVEKGPIFNNCPPEVTMIDLRYGGPSLIRGNHPRKEGIWTQYSHLETGLARNVIISDSISNATPIENWRSEPHSMQPSPYGGKLSSEDYRHQHNHYQNLLSEVFNFSDTLNGVAIWGDSGAFVPGAKSWGGFYSARSWPVKWTPYTPSGCDTYNVSDFDAALVGVEVDVLNAGRDWGDPSPILDKSLAKIGVQIVGFGKRNTAAVEIRTEDSDDPSKTSTDRRGAWKWGIIARNALHEGSTLIHCENGKIKRGLDMSRSTCSEGAVLISSGGPKTGITFDDSKSGEIYSEPNGQLVVRAGASGVRVELDGGEHFSISAEGVISMSDNVKQSFKKALDIA